MPTNSIKNTITNNGYYISTSKYQRELLRTIIHTATPNDGTLSKMQNQLAKPTQHILDIDTWNHMAKVEIGNTHKVAFFLPHKKPNTFIDRTNNCLLPGIQAAYPKCTIANFHKHVNRKKNASVFDILDYSVISVSITLMDIINITHPNTPFLLQSNSCSTINSIATMTPAIYNIPPSLTIKNTSLYIVTQTNCYVFIFWY